MEKKLFIHTADLHLDSALKNMGDSDKAAKRRRELTDTFRRIAKYASENSISGVIIAGDMFDEGKTSVSVKREAAAIMRKNSGVMFFLLSGNHDKHAFDGDFLSMLPKNANVLEDGKTLDFDSYTVTGVYGEPDALELDKDKFNIVVAHGDVNSDIKIKSYAGKNVNYLALGHLHSYTKGKIDSKGIWVYSGCPEGRGFDEIGEKGFVLFDTDGGEKFVPFCSRCVREVKVDITGLDNYEDQSDAVRSKVEEISDGKDKDIYKIVLCGELDESVSVDTVAIKDRLASKFFVKVYDETALRINKERLLTERSLKGEFFRVVNSNKDLTEEDKRIILKMGFKALDDMEITND